jgi:hypothetical protein
MDDLQTTQTNPAPAQPAPITTPVVAATPMPTTESKPSSEGSVVSILKNMNWIEVGFGILGAAALYYIITYYRYNINAQKSFQKQMENKIDDLNIKVADVNSVIKKQSTPEPDQYQSFIM